MCLEVKEPSLSGWYPALPSAGPGPCRCVDIPIGLLSDDQQLVPGEIRTEQGLLECGVSRPAKQWVIVFSPPSTELPVCSEVTVHWVM